MRILLNGEPIELTAAPTVAGLLEQVGLADRKVAVELNQEIRPRSRHTSQALAEGDRVEIIHAIGGG